MKGLLLVFMILGLSAQAQEKYRYIKGKDVTYMLKGNDTVGRIYSCTFTIDHSKCFIIFYQNGQTKDNIAMCFEQGFINQKEAINKIASDNNIPIANIHITGFTEITRTQYYQYIQQ